MKISIFWNITPCNPLKVNLSFGGTFHLHLQGRCFLLHVGFLFGLFFDLRWRRYVPLKRLLTFNGLHGVIFQKTALFTEYIFPSKSWQNDSANIKNPQICVLQKIIGLVSSYKNISKFGKINIENTVDNFPLSLLQHFVNFLP
jgi:hypothetical protein